MEAPKRVSVHQAIFLANRGLPNHQQFPKALGDKLGETPVPQPRMMGSKYRCSVSHKARELGGGAAFIGREEGRKGKERRRGGGRRRRRGGGGGKERRRGKGKERGKEEGKTEGGRATLVI